jgi:hypothetical protein
MTVETYLPQLTRIHYLRQALGFLPHSRQVIAKNLGRAGRAQGSSYSLRELCMGAKRVEFQFHTTGRPTPGRPRFRVAQRMHLANSGAQTGSTLASQSPRSQ